MKRSKQPKLSRKQRAKFEKSIQLQIREYEARYHPGGRDVAAALRAEKFPVDTDASSRQRLSSRRG